jgi:hypothetical protein
MQKKPQVGRDISLTEIDIENLMRAKGAMYAAYMTALHGRGGTLHPRSGTGGHRRRIRPIPEYRAGYHNRAIARAAS